VIAIRKEINDYNLRLCPVKHYSNGMSRSSPLSSTCEYVPRGYCSVNPDGPPGLVDNNISSYTVALASECIIPWLAGVKPSLKQQLAQVGQHDKAKNHRWLYFLAVAVAVGAKVALATTKLCLIDARPVADRRRVLRVAQQRLGQCARVLKRMLVGFGQLTRFAALRVSKLLKRG
jgi:hypothetical protein